WANARENLPEDCADVLRNWLRSYHDPQNLLWRAAICRACLLGYMVPVKQDNTVLEQCAWLLPQIVPALAPTAMWESASSFSQIRLTLQTFPEHVFRPTPRQEELLVRDREWLSQHLQHRSSKAQQYNLALYPCKFMSLDYGTKGAVEWKDEFSERPCV